MPENVIDLAGKRPEKPDPNTMNKAYKDLILQAVDDLEHEGVREFKELRSEVERAARRRL